MDGTRLRSRPLEVVGDRLLPFGALGWVGLGHFSYIRIYGRVEGGSLVHDADAGVAGVDGRELHVDAGGELAGDDVDVGGVAGLGVEGGVDPGCVMVAVMNAEDGSFDIFGGRGKDELRV